MPLHKLLTIELSLVDNATDQSSTTNRDDAMIDGLVTNVSLTTFNTFHLWSIVNVQAKYDLIELDVGINNSYVNKTIQYKTCTFQYQTIARQVDFAKNITRALARLKSVCVRLHTCFSVGTGRTTVTRGKDWNDVFSLIIQHVSNLRV